MANTTAVLHGYYPSTVYLPHYVTNKDSTLSLIAQFAVLWALALGIASVIIRRARNSVARSDQFAFIWMCFSKYILRYHCSEVILTVDEISGMHPSIL